MVDLTASATYPQLISNLTATSPNFTTFPGAVFLINGGMFIIVLLKIFKKGKYKKFEGKAQKIISQMKAICTLSCVLGK